MIHFYFLALILVTGYGQVDTHPFDGEGMFSPQTEPKVDCNKALEEAPLVLTALQDIAAHLDSFNFRPGSGDVLDALNLTVARIGSQREELNYELSYQHYKLLESISVISKTVIDTNEQIVEMKKSMDKSNKNQHRMEERIEHVAAVVGRNFPEPVN